MDQSVASAPRPALHYDGRLGELYSMFLTNILFTILTLGIYQFWAVTRFRRYLWSRMAHGGRRFAYTGTGGELFAGFLLAVLAIIALFATVVGIMWLLPPEWALLPVVPFYATIAVLAAGAIYAAQRYRLSRTTWAGIQGGMGGAAWRYGVRVILYGAAWVLSLFQLTPWVQVRLAEQRINASRFGATPFRFEGVARALYLPFLLTFLGLAAVGVLIGFGVFGAVGLASENWGTETAGPAFDRRMALAQGMAGTVVAGALMFLVAAAVLGTFYRALLARHIMGRTTLGPLRFGSSVTGLGLLGLSVGNALILVFTLGLGYPIVLHRDARFLARTLWVQGTLDPAMLGQAAGPAPRFGEGMYQYLDGGGMT